MNLALRRSALYGLPYLAALATFATQDGPVRWAAAAAGVLVVAVFVARSDEVARLVALKASAVAFLVALLAALALPALGLEGLVQANLQWGWAALMTAWMVGWAIFRARLG